METLAIVSYAYGSPELGPNRRVYYMGKYLSDYYSVIGLGIANWKKYNKLSPEVELVNSNYKILRWNISKVRILSEFFFLCKSLAKAIKCDIVIISIPSPVVVILTPCLKIMGKRVVLDIRDNWSDILPYGKLVRKFYTLYVWSMGYLWVDSIISVKEGDLDSIGKLCYLNNKNLAWISNGIDSELVKYSPVKIRAENPRLIYVGGQGKYYDLDKYINILADNYDINIDFTMNEVEWKTFKSKLTPIARAKVSNIGRFDLNSLVEILSNYDAGLAFMDAKLATNAGVSMNKIYDYLAAGIPVFGVLPETKILNNKKVGHAVDPSSSVDEIILGFEKFLSAMPYDSMCINREAYKYSYNVLFKPLISEGILNYINT